MECTSLSCNVRCGSINKRTANLREFSRIAFFLRRRALLRLIACAGIARRLEKCWGKTRVRVFLILYGIPFFESGCGDATSARSVPRWRYLVYEINQNILDFGVILEKLDMFQDEIQTLMKTRS